MGWKQELKKSINDELQDYTVYFSIDEIPLGLSIPPEWKDFGYKQAQRKHLPAAWAEFSESLPWIWWWLNECVVGTVVAVSDKPYLMYVYHENGEVSFYMGGRQRVANSWKKLNITAYPRVLKNSTRSCMTASGFISDVQWGRRGWKILPPSTSCVTMTTPIFQKCLPYFRVVQVITCALTLKLELRP